jgi:hypothetical protein
MATGTSSSGNVPAKRTVVEVFGDASAVAVEHAATRLRSRLRHKRWLASTNAYLERAPKRLDKQLPRRRETARILPRGSHDATHLAEYIAASTILHCADGWAYLGRAMAAQLRGDIGAACHLAYYAELRAAVSLLAGEGIGVFNQVHAVLGESGDVTLFRQEGTHVFAWNALSRWTLLPRSQSIFGEIIEPADAPLADWLGPLASGSVWGAHGREYLHTWGLDVKRFALDREARNDSSYQPRTIFGATAPTSIRAAQFGRDFWELFEPEGISRFGLLDRYLLRRMLRHIFKARENKRAVDHPKDFATFVEPALERVQTSVPHDQLISFFLSKAPEPPLFAEAEQDSSIDDPEDHLQVISRAALLLRVASGAARRLLAQATLSFANYEWWVRQMGANRALALETAESLERPEELWGDVEAAIEALDQMIPAGETDTYVEMGDGGSLEVAMLGGCERIALWGLAA